MNTLELPRYVIELGWYPQPTAAPTVGGTISQPGAEEGSDTFDAGEYDEGTYG